MKNIQQLYKYSIQRKYPIVTPIIITNIIWVQRAMKISNNNNKYYINISCNENIQP
jgi:hypothetical protein